MTDTTVMLIMGALLLFVIFILPQLRLRMAIPSVIRLFRQNNAVDIENAKTIGELGLMPKSMVQAMIRGQDYRMTALQVLRKAEVIRSTEDSKLYLSEKDLENSRWKGR